MTRRISLDHEFDCSVDLFWEIALDVGFNSRLMARLGLPERELLERRVDPLGARPYSRSA